MKISLQEVTQAIIAMVMVGITAWCVGAEKVLPDQWVNMVLLVVGFYFGRAIGGTVTLPSGNMIATATAAAFLTLPGVHWFMNRFQ